MAKAFLISISFDSITIHHPFKEAMEGARKEGLTENIEFRSVSANESIGSDYDLITFFDCLHDMGDPVGAMKFAKQSLKSDGTCMIVEPMANDNLKDNLNLVSRIILCSLNFGMCSQFSSRQWTWIGCTGW